MATSWPIYSVDEIRQGILDSYTVYRPDDSTDEGSDAWVEANAIAIQLYRLQARDAEVASWISILFATGEHLDTHAVIWLGAANARKGATSWIGKIQLTATSGTPTVLTGQTGTHANGAAYATTADVDPGDWVGGLVTVGLEATTAGTIGNQNDGSTITLSSPPAGVSSTATLVVDADTVLGTDAESDDALRQRVLNATQNRPASGNWAHFREWAESVDGVDVAFVYSRFYGITTTLVVPMGPVGSRVISDDTKTAVEAAIEAARPGGSIPTVLKVTESDVSIEVEITPSAGSEPDWTGTLTTAAGCSVTDVVCTTDPALDGVEAGVRIVVPVTISGKRTTQQRVVESVDTPTKTITVTEAFGAIPGATEDVTPGGPAWQPAYDAISACFDTLGPARSTDPDVPRWPSWVGAYTSRLFLSDIYHAVDAATGVAGCTVVAPVANVDPTVSPHATSIPLLVLDPEILITWST